MDFDEELVNILCSCESTKQLCDTIEILKDRCALNASELKLLKDFTDDIETYGSTDTESKFKDYEEIHKYSSLELDDAIETYVKERYDREFGSIFESGDMYKPEKVNYYFNGYHKMINSTINGDLFSDDIFMDNEDNVISTNSDVIDKFSRGLRKGYITTLVGDEGTFKSLWAVNIAYTAVVNATNVMYLSLGNNKETTAKRLMARHSCNERFPEGMSYEAMHNPNNLSPVSNIVNDFMSKYSRNIVLYDEGDLKIASVASLRRLIAMAQKYFLDETASGIDLIIIDDFTYMSLSKNGKVTRNRNVVVDEYYRYLKGEAGNILGTGYACSVLCTHQHKGGIEVEYNSGEYKLFYIPEPVVLCSDNIFTINGSIFDDSHFVARTKVAKSTYGEIMNRSEKISVDPAKWYMSFDDKSIAETRTLCKLKDAQIADLKSYSAKLEEQLDNQAQALEQYSKQDNEDMDVSLGTGILSTEEVSEFRKQNPIDQDNDNRSDGGDNGCISMCC